MRWSRPSAVLPFLVVLLASGGCAPRGAERGHGPDAAGGKPIGDTLTMTVVPYEAAEKLNEDYGLMAAYLARKMGAKSGKFVPVVDYAGVLAALQAGQVDVAYLSPFPYALASGQMKLYPLAMPVVEGSLLYYGVLFVKADSPIRSVQDLAGRTVAFGDRSSTTGYILPRALLEKQGVFGRLKKWYNAGNSEIVVKAVETGAADVGCAYNLIFQVAYKGHPEQAKKMRVIGRTEEIPNGVYVARGDLPPDAVERLKKAFLDMNTDPEGRAAMRKAPHDKVVPPDDKLFDSVRDAARKQNIDIRVFDRK